MPQIIEYLSLSPSQIDQLNDSSVDAEYRLGTALETVTHWRSLLFVPDEMPGLSFGLYAYLHVMHAYAGYFSAFSPFGRNNFEYLPYAVEIAERLDDKFAHKEFTDIRSKLSKFSESDLLGYSISDEKIGNAALFECINKIVWRDSLRNWAKVKLPNSQTLVTMISLLFETCNVKPSDEKDRLDIVLWINEIPDYHSRVDELDVDPDTRGYLRETGERYVHSSAILNGWSKDEYLAIKKFQTTSREWWRVQYLDAIEYCEPGPGEIYKTIVKPNPNPGKAVQHHWRYADAKGWKFDQKSQKLSRPFSLSRLFR